MASFTIQRAGVASTHAAAARVPRRARSLVVRAATALPAEVSGPECRKQHNAPAACSRRPPIALSCCLQVKTVTPVGDRVFVKAEEAEATTVGGILLPSSAQKRPTQGTVQSAGGAKAVKVRRRPPPPAHSSSPLLPALILMPRFLQAGDKVVYSKYAGTELELQGENFVLLKVGRRRAGGGGSF